MKVCPAPMAVAFFLASSAMVGRAGDLGEALLDGRMDFFGGGRHKPLPSAFGSLAIGVIIREGPMMAYNDSREGRSASSSENAEAEMERVSQS
jgi:hypothetical protein